MRGLHRLSELAETPGCCSLAAGLPQRLASVELQQGGDDETEMGASTLETGRKKGKKKKEKEKERPCVRQREG